MSPQTKGKSLKHTSPKSPIKVCSICLDDLNPNNKNNKHPTGLLTYKLVSCEHEFHKDCILKWMKTQSNNTRNNRTVSCPYCRIEISYLDKLFLSIKSDNEYKGFIGDIKSLVNVWSDTAKSISSLKLGGTTALRVFTDLAKNEENKRNFKIAQEKYRINIKALEDLILKLNKKYFDKYQLYFDFKKNFYEFASLHPKMREYYNKKLKK
jgi:hypothetical protein